MGTIPKEFPNHEEMAAALEAAGDYRVLRRYQRPSAYHTPANAVEALNCIRTGLVIDTETTGLGEDAKIIELGAVAFEFSVDDGRIFRILNAQSWFEDPGEPLSDEVKTVTGITDEMVAGQRIDDAAFLAMLGHAELVIAHNAAFDRPKLERRFPAAAVKHWACSVAEIDWKGEGIGSAKLDYIAYRMGFFFDAHRAVNDCLALVHALAQPLPISGGMALDALLLRARRPTMRVWALDTPFAVKDALKARGYSWCDGTAGKPKSWYRDVDPNRLDDEKTFLNGLAGCCSETRVVRLTARDRYSDRAWRLA